MIERGDYTTGERQKVGAYVDEGVYSAFRTWVEAQTGKQYGSVGTAIERAMLEYMDDDKIDQKLQEIVEQTRKNEALLRKLEDRGVGENRKKEKGKTAEFSDEVPKGKNPGDREAREMYVIRALVGMDGDTVSRELVENAVRSVAGVKSDPTVEDYTKSITNSQAFTTSQVMGQWHIDEAGAKELLEKNGIPIEVEP